MVQYLTFSHKINYFEEVIPVGDQGTPVRVGCVWCRRGDTLVRHHAQVRGFMRQAHPEVEVFPERDLPGRAVIANRSIKVGEIELLHRNVQLAILLLEEANVLLHGGVVGRQVAESWEDALNRDDCVVFIAVDDLAVVVGVIGVSVDDELVVIRYGVVL